MPCQSIPIRKDDDILQIENHITDVRNHVKKRNNRWSKQKDHKTAPPDFVGRSRPPPA
jgi:hypothetical protein